MQIIANHHLYQLSFGCSLRKTAALAMEIIAKKPEKWLKDAAFVTFYTDRHYPAGDRKSKQANTAYRAIYLILHNIKSARQNTLVAQRRPVL
jgi:hypothetical protein